LPRLWKTGPDEPDDEAAPSRNKQEKAGSEKTSASSGNTPNHAAKAKAKSKPKKQAPETEGGDKKVLIEETPALDTYEARQRARLVLGGLVATCFLIFFWIVYSVFLSDSNPIEMAAEDTGQTFGPAQPKRDVDGEAHVMLNRAHDSAKAGNTKEAVKLLENVIKVYKGTKTAALAKEALDRPKEGLPLFLDRPTVKAETPAQPAPEPAPAPPQVVVVQPKPTQGNATLTLPANPAELTTSQPSPLAMAPTAVGGTKSPTVTRTLSEGFSAKSDAGVHSSGWPLAIVGKRDGGTMVFVPGGTFTMGNDDGPPQEAPAHQVRLSSYYIDQHEVTVRQFGLFLKETHYHGSPPHNWSEDAKGKNTSDSSPMVMVNARDAQAYADWALKQLPTEAQWEMAARATDGRLFPSGPEPIKYSKPRAPRQAEPVMSYPEDVSPYGAYDMAGNVWEWTKDWYDSKYYRQLSGQPSDNPTGPSAKPRSLQLVVKGGAKNGSASFREGMVLDKRFSYVGFRCVLPAHEQASLINPAPGAPAPSQPAPASGQPANPPAGQSQSVPVPF
jgi:formylglycine-generating enzyme required for sulfatase activity